MARLERSHVELLLRVARMYYEEDRSQAQIAATIGFSRPTVSRLLAEARDREIVRITISHPLEQSLEIESQLRRMFGLAHAAVAANQPGASAAQLVGLLAGEVIASHGDPHTMLALSNGRSIAAVVEAMPAMSWPTSFVIQMIGSLGRVDDQMVDSPELCRRMAERLGGRHRPLPVPIVLGSPEVTASVLKEEVVATTLELAARADITICGVGAIGPGNAWGSVLRPYMTAEIIEQARRGKAVAHIGGHHYDARGRHVRTALCDRLISLPPERLAEVKMSMAVAWGVEKVAALHAVLQTGFISSLVTDELTARLLVNFRP